MTINANQLQLDGNKCPMITIPSGTALRVQGVTTSQPRPPAPFQEPETKRHHLPGQPLTRGYYKAPAPHLPSNSQNSSHSVFCIEFLLPPKSIQEILLVPKVSQTRHRKTKKTSHNLSLAPCQSPTLDGFGSRPSQQLSHNAWLVTGGRSGRWENEQSQNSHPIKNESKLPSNKGNS